MLPRLAGDSVWVEVDDLRFYGSRKHQTYLSRLANHSFEPFKMKLFNEAVKPQMIVADVGAYIGYHTVLASRLTGPLGKVYAFECDPRSHRFLAHNVKLNNCANTVLSNCAVGNISGPVPFFLEGDPATSNTRHHGAQARMVEVACATLDELLSGHPVHVVKMSIQGGEIRGLQGMEKTLAASGRVVMFVECSPATLRHAGSTTDDLLSQLREFGFSLQVIDENRRCLRAVGEQDYLERTEQGRKNFFYLYCCKDHRTS
jgi:FkbM family methyltransferase